MEPTEGARSFQTTGDAYDAFMGRYSRPLAAAFADAAGVTGVTGSSDTPSALDVGCGPGALTGVLVHRLGAASVSACDPSPPFVTECGARHPGVDVRLGRAEALPFEDDRFDHALAQLVLHFVSDPTEAANELRRVLRPGGTAAACVWDVADGMEMLRAFWDAAVAIDPGAPDEARTLRFGGPGEIAELLDAAGFEQVAERTLRVSSTYEDFDDLWSGFLAGIGPAGAFTTALPPERRAALRDALLHRLGSPTGSFTLAAVARATTGRAP